MMRILVILALLASMALLGCTDGAGVSTDGGDSGEVTSSGSSNGGAGTDTVQIDGEQGTSEHEENGQVFGSADREKAGREGEKEPPQAIVDRTLREPTVVDYADTDAFDAVLEAALQKKMPLIVVNTGTTKPNWEGRLNGWIAAWNEGWKDKEDEWKAFLESRTTVLRAADGYIVQPMDPSEYPPLLKWILDWLLGRHIKKHRMELLKPYLLIVGKDDKGRYRVLFYRKPTSESAE